MRLLFVADGRSPIAQNWIRYFVEGGDDVFLASTFLCSPDFPLQGLEIVPVAFSGTQRGAASGRSAASSGMGLRSAVRHFLGPLTIPHASQRLREFIERVKPDLVHAMRIPYEGMLAADAYTGAPLIVSVWGNDFTLHAPSSWMMRHYTRWTMKVADALHADCQRDVRLAKQWGLEPSKPTLVLPGNGGIKTDIFYPPQQPVEKPVILNPRGFRTYVRNDIFFRAIPLVLAKHPDAKFVCAAMAGDRQALRWAEQLQIQQAVELLPPMAHPEMAGIFRRAQIVVSPSIHDGTPNSLLEGMACGCFPIAGDLDSVREWITDGKNGLLMDATQPQSVADAIGQALQNRNLRQQAAGWNAKLIEARAEYGRGMSLAKKLYESVVQVRER